MGHKWLMTGLIAGLMFTASNCRTVETSSQELAEGSLKVRKGYLDFMKASVLNPLKAALPTVTDQSLADDMSSKDTIWYDQDSMVFVYQDSMESVTGVRENRVGFEVGDRNRIPDIKKLMTYFKKGSFKFPYAGVAGTDEVTNLKSLNFWVPAKDELGEVIPVKWWKTSRRGRWNWIHPVGTKFGEVLFQKAPDGDWVVFEVRVRMRYIEGWDVDVFRPFAKASETADAIKAKRPNWKEDSETAALVNQLEDKDSLTPKVFESKPYAKLFDRIDGSLDVLPGVSDSSLIKELLTETEFKSVKGRAWKSNETMETYAPGSDAEFGIVPKGYALGMIEVNEVSCNRCHQSTGVQLGHLDGAIVLYGEMWGEDRIFTWHLFEPNNRIYGTFDEADGSRKINKRLVESGLIVEGKPAADSKVYKSLPMQIPNKK